MFWPDDEMCEAECVLPDGHPGSIHEDEILGEWNEDYMLTTWRSNAT